MRLKGFTLIELLVIIALMGIMLGAGVVGVNAMSDSSRLAGTTRDVMALVRRARSLALVRQKPIVLVYSNVRDEAGEHAQVEIVWDKPKPVEDEDIYDLDGKLVYGADRSDDGESFGTTMTEFFSNEQIEAEVVSGIKLAFYDESERLVIPENETRRSKISIYSTVDSVARSVETTTKSEEVGAKNDAGESLPAEEQGPWKVCFAPNGTLDKPHRIVLYPEGALPQDGMVLHVDRFGEPVCEEVR